MLAWFCGYKLKLGESSLECYGYDFISQLLIETSALLGNELLMHSITYYYFKM